MNHSKSLIALAAFFVFCHHSIAASPQCGESNGQFVTSEYQPTNSNVRAINGTRAIFWQQIYRDSEGYSYPQQDWILGSLAIKPEHIGRYGAIYIAVANEAGTALVTPTGSSDMRGVEPYFKGNLPDRFDVLHSLGASYRWCARPGSHYFGVGYGILDEIGREGIAAYKDRFNNGDQFESLLKNDQITDQVSIDALNTAKTKIAKQKTKIQTESQLENSYMYRYGRTNNLCWKVLQVECPLLNNN